MRRGQPSMWFAFTALVGLVRALSYAGTPLGQEFSLAALFHFVALHMAAFTVGTFIVGALSRATATRAAQVALYAQFALFLGAFVDAALGTPILAYEATYSPLFGGSAGALLGGATFALVLAWGVWDATGGAKRPRWVAASIAFAGGFSLLAFATVPWIRPLLGQAVPWSVHLALTVYFGVVATAFLALTVRFASPWLQPWFGFRRETLAALAFLAFPTMGIVAAGRLSVIPNPAEPLLRAQIEFPYWLVAASVGAALGVQLFLVFREGLGPRRLEVASIAKVIVLAYALLLGWAPFVAAGIAASLAWLAATPSKPLRLAVLGLVGAFGVAVGDLTAVAVDFAEYPIGAATFLVAVDPASAPSSAGSVAATILAVGTIGMALVTNRTSGSETGRASS